MVDDHQYDCSTLTLFFFFVHPIDQPQAPVGVVFHCSNLTLQWQQTAHPCDYTTVSIMGGANKTFTVGCNVTMKVFDVEDFPLTTNLTFEVQAVNCAGRSAPGFTNYQVTPTCIPSPVTVPPSGKCVYMYVYMN